ncbi:hypothetical protein MLD38_003539 [Melastoma candidum]|nr:hypothetical protein MLD38_003539 [Melastoma candidum]
MLQNVKASSDRAKNGMPPRNIQGFPDEDQMMLVRSKARQVQLKGNQIESSDLSNDIENLPIDMQFDGKTRDGREKKWAAKREMYDFDYNHVMGSSTELNYGILPSKIRDKYSQRKARGGSGRDSREEVGVSRGKAIMSDHDITESDSFEVSDDENNNPLMGSKLVFPGGFSEVSTHALSRPRKNSMKKSSKESARASEGITHAYKDDFGPGLHVQFSPEENDSLKRKKKGKVHGNFSGRELAKDMNGDCFGGSDYHDMSRLYQNNGFLGQEPGDSPQMSSIKSYPDDVKLRQRVSRADFVADEVELVEERHPVANDELYRQKRKGKNIVPSDRLDGSEATFMSCSLVTKKRKLKERIAVGDGKNEDDLELHQVEESSRMTKNKRKKLDPDLALSGKGTPEMSAVGTPVAEVEMEPEIIPKKKTFTLITPTVHTGFSFSIIHLLSAVRMALVTMLLEDSLNVGKSAEDEMEKCDSTDGAVASQVDVGAPDLVQSATANVPSLSIQEIVNRVRSNPGDPCILETQEPLQDLVRGVLKIFQMKSAPLGAKGWKSLVVFEKSTKSWSWVGPVSSSPSDLDAVEEMTSPEAWGLPQKMMVKLVDAFANWLKNSQETLQQIGSLPPPPPALMEFNSDEKERFRDLRAQKSHSTISPSSDEIRDYFRQEEVLRYSIPDRAFSYTAADGKKSIVAPLRRCGGKPTSKARDHFMLKKDRPPHVTVLCLVRDATARLPGSIGTRADVCTLIRDSQFIVEDVSDAQVNQVVSGALDRLHYERDPCVQFDSERKLWKYLHREREEEDFEDDGTSSTKKWRRPKKEGTEQSDQGVVTTADQQWSEEQTGPELCSNLNVESLYPDNEMAGILLEADIRPVVDVVAVNGCMDNENASHDDQSGLWGGLDYDPPRENKLPCQENSTNNDFDDETFGQDHAELLDTGLL